MQLWGKATDGDRSVEATLETPEGYALTVLSAIAATERVGRGDVKPGAWTPAQAFGSGFISELPGCEKGVVFVSSAMSAGAM